MKSGRTYEWNLCWHLVCCGAFTMRHCFGFEAGTLPSSVTPKQPGRKEGGAAARSLPAKWEREPTVGCVDDRSTCVSRRAKPERSDLKMQEKNAVFADAVRILRLALLLQSVHLESHFRGSFLTRKQRKGWVGWQREESLR